MLTFAVSESSPLRKLPRPTAVESLFDAMQLMQSRASPLGQTCRGHLSRQLVARGSQQPHVSSHARAHYSSHSYSCRALMELEFIAQQARCDRCTCPLPAMYLRPHFCSSPAAAKNLAASFL